MRVEALQFLAPEIASRRRTDPGARITTAASAWPMSPRFVSTSATASTPMRRAAAKRVFTSSA